MSGQYADGSFREDWKRRALAAEARAERAEAALRPFANLGVGSGPGELCETYKIERNAIRNARAALAVPS